MVEVGVVERCRRTEEGRFGDAVGSFPHGRQKFGGPTTIGMTFAKPGESHDALDRFRPHLLVCLSEPTSLTSILGGE